MSAQVSNGSTKPEMFTGGSRPTERLHVLVASRAGSACVGHRLHLSRPSSLQRASRCDRSPRRKIVGNRAEADPEHYEIGSRSPTLQGHASSIRRRVPMHDSKSTPSARKAAPPTSWSQRGSEGQQGSPRTSTSGLVLSPARHFGPGRSKSSASTKGRPDRQVRPRSAPWSELDGRNGRRRARRLRAPRRGERTRRRPCPVVHLPEDGAAVGEERAERPPQRIPGGDRRGRVDDPRPRRRTPEIVKASEQRALLIPRSDAPLRRSHSRQS